MGSIDVYAISSAMFTELAELLAGDGWWLKDEAADDFVTLRLGEGSLYESGFLLAKGKRHDPGITLWAPGKFDTPLAEFSAAVPVPEIVAYVRRLVAEDTAFAKRVSGQRAAVLEAGRLRLPASTVHAVNPVLNCNKLNDHWFVRLPAAPAYNVRMDVLHVKWEVLGTVGITDDGIALDQSFDHFRAGTPIVDVWQWFEAQNPRFSVAEVQRGIKLFDSH